MTMLTRKTKAASLAILAIAAFAIAAPQARAELPDGYKQLGYIETYEGGNQSIATGISADLTHKIEMRVRTLKKDALQYLWFANSLINVGGSQSFVKYSVQLTDDNKFELTYGKNKNAEYDTDKKFGNVEEGHDYMIVTDGKNHTMSLKDETTGDTWFGDMMYDDSITSTSFPAFGDISQYRLLSTLDISQISDPAICRVYSFKVTAADGTGVCNYVPARRTSDGSVGFYDTVRDTFFVQDGDGAAFNAPVKIVQTELDTQKGEATLTFDYIPATMDVVVVWGEEDYGESLGDWPYNKRCKLGSVAETENEVSHTYALPAEALVPGTHYRFFLGTSAQTAYDEEVEWIQPATIGAYIQTDFIPSARPQSETKLNLDNQTYTNAWVSLYDAGTTWAHGVWAYANAEGRIGARRAGYADFGPFSTNDDLIVGLVPRDKYYAITVNDVMYWNDTYNQDVSITPEVALSFWRFVHDDGDHSMGYSKYRLYWSKWWNNDKTTLEANIIPVKKDGEYMLYDCVSGKLFKNSGEAGTSFTGGEKVEGSYPMAYFAQLQTSASVVQQIPVPISLTRMDVAFENGSAKLSVELQWDVAADEIKVYTTTDLAEADSWQLRDDAVVEGKGSDGKYTVTIPDAPATLFIILDKQ